MGTLSLPCVATFPSLHPCGEGARSGGSCLTSPSHHLISEGLTHPSCPSQDPHCCGSEYGSSSVLMTAAHSLLLVPHGGSGAGRVGLARSRSSARAELSTQMGSPKVTCGQRCCIRGGCLHGTGHRHVAGVRIEDTFLDHVQAETGLV